MTSTHVHIHTTHTHTQINMQSSLNPFSTRQEPCFFRGNDLSTLSHTCLGEGCLQGPAAMHMGVEKLAHRYPIFFRYEHHAKYIVMWEFRHNVSIFQKILGGCLGNANLLPGDSLLLDTQNLYNHTVPEPPRPHGAPWYTEFPSSSEHQWKAEVSIWIKKKVSQIGKMERCWSKGRSLQCQMNKLWESKVQHGDYS